MFQVEQADDLPEIVFLRFLDVDERLIVEQPDALSERPRHVIRRDGTCKAVTERPRRHGSFFGRVVTVEPTQRFDQSVLDGHLSGHLRDLVGQRTDHYLNVNFWICHADSLDSRIGD